MRHSNKKDKFISIGGPVILLAILILAGQLAITAAAVPKYILPTPLEVFTTLKGEFVSKILPEAIATVKVVLCGFILGVPAGVALAAVFSQIDFLNQVLSPVVVVLVCTPLISLVPLLMLVMGIGQNVRILAVFLQVFPIVLMNAFTGFNNVEPIKLELMKSMGASKITAFIRVVFPDALPHVFTGIKLGTILATTTAISTEIVSGTEGLGNLMMYAKGLFLTDLVLATVLICAIIGIVLYSVIRFIERRIIRWSI